MGVGGDPTVCLDAPGKGSPDLTDPDQRTSFFQTLRPLMEELTSERIAADGSAYLDELARAGAPGPVAVTGYYMGARVGWRIAAANPDRVDALAGFHAGGLVSDDPESPHASASELDAELYFGFADQDPSMSAEQMATLGRALSDAGVRCARDLRGRSAWLHDGRYGRVQRGGPRAPLRGAARPARSDAPVRRSESGSGC